MCGRYLFDPRTGELSDYYQELVTIAKEQNKKIAVDEVFPSNQVVTLIADDSQQIVPILTHWGFTGFKKGQLLINARAETVEEKRTFKKPFLEKRCAFPMSGFYEWDSDKHKFLFDSSEPLYLAGFYRNHSTTSGSEDESIILTTKPNATIAPIHDRMPVLLSKADVLPWITDVTFARNYLLQTMPDIHPQPVS
ncbi:SOS response-associated peptidase [Enterococcus gallinarum]|uniref:SOS response-associated peptidase n=1 Tax=Enterococcus gallinarum TaxID=1353 RepID=UPI00214B7972|nr:SOS response-associated peptidase [Enterococcus gallinarum]MCR1927382.1 SOS response-associated peptidase [Enterococcus gallinarum]